MVDRGGVLARKLCRITEVDGKQVAQYLFGADPGFLHLRVAVELGEQKSLQLRTAAAHRRTECDQWRLRADSIHIRRIGCRQRRGRGVDDVVNLR